MDTLLDDLWHGEPPPAAVAVVDLLSTASEGRSVGTRSRPAPGYVLRLDAGRSMRSASSASLGTRRSYAAGRALAALGDALALWRGTAFADLAFEPFLQAEIARPTSCG